MIDKKKAEEIYKKSFEIMERVQLDNGGILATPKGERYPFIYPRDHSICLLALIETGKLKEAEKGLEFLFRSQMSSGAFPQRYNLKGKDASYKPVQIDSTALVLYSFAKYVKKTKDREFFKKNYKRISRAANYIIKNFHKDKKMVYTPNSIHEFPPTEAGLEAWSNATCCAALRELSKLFTRINRNHKKWEKYSGEIKKGINKYLWNSREQFFVKNIRIRESSSVLLDADASLIGLEEFGVINARDERMQKTVKKIEKELWNEELGGLCRYTKHRGRHNGGYGPWPHFTLLVGKHFIRLKNKKKADKYLKWVIDIAWNDMLPEHVATVKEFNEYVTDFSEAGLLREDRKIMIDNARKHPAFKTGIAYITLPLAWPHAEFIRTMNLYKKTFK